MYIRAVEVYERSRSDTFNNCYTKATKLNPLLEFSIAKNIAISKSDLDWLGFGALIFPFFVCYCFFVFQIQSRTKCSDIPHCQMKRTIGIISAKASEESGINNNIKTASEIKFNREMCQMSFNIN